MMDYYKKTADEIVEEFSSQTKAGLSNQEAQKRYEKYGPNRFAEEEERFHGEKDFTQFNGLYHVSFNSGGDYFILYRYCH